MPLPSFVSSFLILKSERSHWRVKGVCASGYACGTSLAHVIHHHLLTQSTPGDYHAMVISLWVFCLVQLVYTFYLESLYIQKIAMMWLPVYLFVFLPLCAILWFWGVKGVVTGGRVGFVLPAMLVGLPSLLWSTIIFWPRGNLDITTQQLL